MFSKDTITVACGTNRILDFLCIHGRSTIIDIEGLRKLLKELEDKKKEKALKLKSELEQVKAELEKTKRALEKAKKRKHETIEVETVIDK
ncbi:unnamed protein product [Auanema sp. JU1783]|nr:unnamed protein product [Auanema sp. JU1783]